MPAMYKQGLRGRLKVKTISIGENRVEQMENFFSVFKF